MRTDNGGEHFDESGRVARIVKTLRLAPDRLRSAARYAAGMTQQQIADALGVDRTTVSFRIKWHESMGTTARKAVLDGTIDEGHLTAVSSVVLDVQHANLLHPWLTTEQAQAELRGRGIMVGVPPNSHRDRRASRTGRIH